MTNSRLYFRQLLAGREFARNDDYATQMRNFCYLLGDRESRECVIVDPAWDVRSLVDLATADGMKVVGALATHYHPDHIGGDFFGMHVEGITKLMEISGVPIHVNRNEAHGVRAVTGLSASDLALHDSGDAVRVGDVKIEMLHTPGHTPGSQCFLVEGRLVSGDTLFVQGCGRVDLPGSDPAEMYLTLTQRLASLPGDTALFPGHHYGPRVSSTMADERVENYYLRPRSLEDWLALMG